MMTTDAILPFLQKFLVTLKSREDETSALQRKDKVSGGVSETDAWRLTVEELFEAATDAPEYEAAIDALKAEPRLRDRLNEVVGISGMARSFWSPPSVLRAMVHRLWPYRNAIRGASDMQMADVVETEIAKRATTYGFVEYIAPIFGLSTDLLPLELSEEVALVTLTNVEIEVINRSHLQGPMIIAGEFVPPRGWCGIRLSLRRPVLIGELSRPIEELAASEAPYNTISNIILALRLTRQGDLVCPGVVARSNQAGVTQTRYFHDTGRIRYFPAHYLKNDDIHDLRTVLDNIGHPTVAKNKALQIAIRRFTYALDRERLDDRILDLAIAGEAILQPYARGETALRLALATAGLLGSSMAERYKMYKFMKAVYRVRGELAHGNDDESGYVTLDGDNGSLDEMSADLENVIRKAIRLALVATASGTRLENWEEILFRQ
jgi:hypothetical protein